MGFEESTGLEAILKEIINSFLILEHFVLLLITSGLSVPIFSVTLFEGREIFSNIHTSERIYSI